MPQGRGQGWEEKIQHVVLRRHFVDVEKVPAENIKHEFSIEVKKLKTGVELSKVSVDFVVDRGDYYEVVECKDWNHPTFNIGLGFGQALAYRELMEMEQVYPNKPKPIRISLCFVDRFHSLYGDWTPAHDALMSKLAEKIEAEVRVYLVQPLKDEYSAEKHWSQSEKFTVSVPPKCYFGL